MNKTILHTAVFAAAAALAAPAFAERYFSDGLIQCRNTTAGG